MLTEFPFDSAITKRTWFDSSDILSEFKPSKYADADGYGKIF